MYPPSLLGLYCCSSGDAGWTGLGLGCSTSTHTLLPGWCLVSQDPGIAPIFHQAHSPCLYSGIWGPLFSWDLEVTLFWVFLSFWDSHCICQLSLWPHLAPAPRGLLDMAHLFTHKTHLFPLLILALVSLFTAILNRRWSFPYFLVPTCHAWSETSKRISLASPPRLSG
jgi:hypothetical protein